MTKGITGGCYCGAIRYEAATEPTSSSICYCRDCSGTFGSQSVAWVTFPVDTFHFTEGAPAEYKSSPPVTRTFCGNCGTSISYRHDRRKTEIDIATATLDDPARFPPTGLVYPSHKIAWDALPGLPVVHDPQ